MKPIGNLGAARVFVPREIEHLATDLGPYEVETYAHFRLVVTEAPAAGWSA